MDFNPLDPAFRANPYPAYRELRENAPVYENPAFNAAIVSRYDDVSYVLKNPALFSSAGMGGIDIEGRRTRTIINTDPPVHTRMRNMVNRAFTPRMVAEMEPRIREIARELLDAVVGNGKMDLVSDLAIPLPVTIIAEILGVDPSRRDDFKRWSNAIISNDTSNLMNRSQAGEADVAEFTAFFEQAIDERRRAPKDDLISAIVKMDPEDDDPLTPDEVLAFTGLLLIAGNETTTNLIGNAMLALLAHSDQLDAVSSDPALIPNMVEEALRYDSPVQFLFRTATQDVDVAGTTIRAGETVVPIYASGNRDDRKFPDGETFDITRNTQGHLAFGLGVHFCLGAPLARLEAKVAFEELFAHGRNFERTGDTVERIDSLFLRGLATLPLTFEPIPPAART